MKQLKHLQIFEAFDSKVLSKTLGYIKDPNDKEKFFNQIKRLCNSISYPLSKMSDDYFEYLPFKSALYKASKTGDEPCEATSASEFPGYAVEGAKCENGKIKRKWGSRTREVVCPVCNGTGVKPKKSELKLLKFWFTAEGKYVTTTLVDGIIRGHVGSSSSFSTRLSDYTEGNRVRNSRDLEGGEIVKINIGGEEMVAYIYKQSGGIYALQNKKSGSAPSGNSWRQYARYSWNISNGEYNSIHILTPKNKSKKEKLEEEADPYDWNVGCNFSYGSISSNTSIDVRDAIKDAHFAIVFDFGKMKKSDYEKTELTKASREERKAGSKLDPTQSDEEIKRRNIERYVNQLSQRLDIATDIANCNRLVSRSLGHRAALYIVANTNIYSSLSSIIDQYIKFMTSDNDIDKKRYSEDISEKTNELFRIGMRRGDKALKSIKDIRKKLEDNNSDEKYFQILDLLQKLSDIIYDNIKNYQIDSIEDLEVVAQKISAIRNIIKSDRYRLSRFFSYFIENLTNGREERCYSYLIDSYYTDVDELLQSLPRVINVISKL